MPSHHRENLIMRFRERQRPPAAFEVGADGNEPMNARRTGAGQHISEVGIKIRVIEMSVRVVKNHCGGNVTEDFVECLVWHQPLEGE
jgi:hypothetical protein